MSQLRTVGLAVAFVASGAANLHDRVGATVAREMAPPGRALLTGEAGPEQVAVAKGGSIGVRCTFLQPRASILGGYAARLQGRVVSTGVVQAEVEVSMACGDPVTGHAGALLPPRL